MESVDRDPGAFAAFYRRHAGRLLTELTARTQNPRLASELLAETFAAALAGAHRFDPRGSAAAWLDSIAAAELAHAERTGRARGRARRRLGLPALEPGERLLGELEEELVEAARFRAERARPIARPRLPSLPRPPARAVRAAVAGIAAIALVAAVAALATGGGREDPPLPRAAAGGPSARLVAMVPPPSCFARAFDQRPATPVIPYFSVFDYRPRVDDALGDDIAESLPIASYDPRETKLAANGRRGTRLHLVPSLGVSEDRSCGADDGPGVCLVQDDAGRFRCFGIERIRHGLAFARTERRSIVGIVPDGVGRVTLTAGGRRASAPVSGNVYEAELGVAPGTVVGVELAAAGESDCAREVAPRLLARVAALRRPPNDRLVPMAALSLLREYEAIAEPVERGARFWGADGGVSFWVIPVARTGPRGCAPATGVCVVALTTGERADAECGLNVSPRRAAWRFAPLLGAHGAIYGRVPDGVTGARITFGQQVAEVRARDNVLAGVLPFPYAESAEVELVRRPLPAPPRVGIVDAGGDVFALRDRLLAAGYEPLGAIVPGIKRQPRSAVYWRRSGATRAEAAAVARVAGAPDVIRVVRERTPLPVIEAGAPVVVVAGSG